jgi:hypothetical protein
VLWTPRVCGGELNCFLLKTMSEGPWLEGDWAACFSSPSGISASLFPSAYLNVAGVRLGDTALALHG